MSDPAVAVGGYSMPCPDGGVAQPVAVVAPVRSARGAVEGDQRGPVRGRSPDRNRPGPAHPGPAACPEGIQPVKLEPETAGWADGPTPRYLPSQLVVVEEQSLQVGEIAQLRRYLPGQLARVPEFAGWRDCPTPPVSPRSTGCCEVQPPQARLPSRYRHWLLRIGQVGQAAQLRRYPPGQLVKGEASTAGWSGPPTPPVSPRSTG